jgi:hypothetical protein
MKRDVWFAIPSASPERCRKTLPIWRERGYKIAVLQNYARGEIPADIVLWSDHYPGWPGSINILCDKVVPKDAPIVVSGGDDMLPDPNHTAHELAEQFLDHFKDSPGGTFGVMQPHGDTFMESPRYCGSPFLGRRWIETMYGGTGPMNAAYHHNWADNELYWVARGLNALWSRSDLSHFHEHFTRTGEEKPAYWREAVETTDAKDCRLFISRAWSRFPGHEPLGISRPFDASRIVGATELAEASLSHHYQQGQLAAEWTATVEKALKRCAKDGLDPVALYGSGTHTRAVGRALVDPPVRIACIIDDNPARQGKRMWNYPIVSQQDAMAMGVRAVILSANAHEGALIKSAAPMKAAGIEIMRLYPLLPHEKSELFAKALRSLAASGKRRLAIFGGGAHTRDCEPAISAAKNAINADIVCVIDDNPALVGGHVAGKVVVPLREALQAKLDAVVLSSDRFENAMWEQAEPLRRSGVEVVRLYAAA